MKSPLEKDIHRMVCKWMKYKYPNVIFRTDFSAGIRLTIGQAKLQKELQSSRAYPDLFIVEPRDQYCGLFIELKRDRSQVLKKDGLFKKDDHVIEQAEMLDRLRAKGFKAEFGFGFDHTIHLIGEYLG